MGSTWGEVIPWYPFSYDSVVPLSDLGGVVPEAPPTPPKQWLVSSRWLVDSDHFNEWMTEEDYQLIIVVCFFWLDLACAHLAFTARRMSVCCRLPLTLATLSASLSGLQLCLLKSPDAAENCK